jgi:hypothetical protein
VTVCDPSRQGWTADPADHRATLGALVAVGRLGGRSTLLVLPEQFTDRDLDGIERLGAHDVADARVEHAQVRRVCVTQYGQRLVLEIEDPVVGNAVDGQRALLLDDVVARRAGEDMQPVYRGVRVRAAT